MPHPLILQITWTCFQAGSSLDLNYGEEVLVSYLPLSHVAAQVNDMWIAVRFAATTHFAEPDALKVRLVLRHLIDMSGRLWLRRWSRSANDPWVGGSNPGSPCSHVEVCKTL